MTEVYRFGRFELDTASRKLLVDQRPVTIGARATDLLIALIERRDRLATKDELLEAVWPGLVVEENNLQVQVSGLRKVLGHHAIQTIPGRGYKFTPIVERLAASAPAPSAPLVHNLPQPLTNFIGHEDDLIEYARHLEQSRLLTLTGVGGWGKTRLAIKLAEAIATSFAGRACFVDMTSTVEGERVPITVASALKAMATRDETVLDSICAAVGGPPYLLILDNCENVLGSCAALTHELLDRCPLLRILATSREGLGIAGERIEPVRTLSLPDPCTMGAPAAREPTEAIRLFLDRAQLVAPAFALDEKSSAAIADICRRLDGIPLAIELAAARVKLLSIEQIRARIRDRFRLLVRDGQSAPRHRALVAVIGWSYEQLGEREQQLLRCLSVFVGSWSLSGATTVMTDGEDEMQVLTLLDRLVDVSLVVVQRVGSDEPRYRMLETVHQYVEERLIAAGERDEVRNRHLEHYLALIETTVGNATEARREWEEDIKRFDRDRENFLVAHAWCDRATGGAQKGIRFANGMRWYWMTSDAYAGGGTSEHRPVAIGVQMILEALARPGLDPKTLDVARAHLNAGNMLRECGRREESKFHLDKGIAVAQHFGHQILIANASYFLSEYFRDLRDFVSATEHLERARAIYEAEGKKRGLIGALLDLGLLQCMLGDNDAAERRIQEGLTLAFAEGAPWDMVLGHLHLTTVEICRCAPTKAARHLVDALDGATDLRSQALFQYALESSIGIAVLLDDNQRGARYFGALEAHRLRRKVTQNGAYDTDLMSFVAKANARIGDTAFQSECSAGREIPLSDAIGDAKGWLHSVVGRVYVKESP